MRATRRDAGGPGSESAKIEKRFLTLIQVASELGGASTEYELFAGLGKRLGELDLQSAVLMLTPDGLSLRPVYISVGKERRAHLSALEKEMHRSWRDLTFERRARHPIDDALTRGEVHFSENLLREMEDLMPGLAAHSDVLAPLFPSWRGMLAPLRAGERLEGILLVLGEGLGEEDRAALGSFSSLVGALLQSLHRLERERERREQLTLLDYITRELNVALPSLDAVSEAVETVLVEEAGYDRVRLGLLDGDHLRIVGSSTRAERRLPLEGAGIMGRVIGLGEPLVISSLRRGELEWDASVAAGTRSLMAVPLRGGLAEDLVLGVLVAESDQRGRFEEDDLDMLQAVGSEVVTALNSVRLFEGMDRDLALRAADLQALVSIGLAVTSELDPQEVLRLLLERTVDILKMERGALILIEHDTEMMRIVEAVGPGKDLLPTQAVPMAGTITEWVSRHPEVVCIPDTRIEGWYTPYLKYWVHPGESCGILVAPLTRGGEVIGTLSCIRKEPNTLDEDDVKMTGWISSWATAALENAHLYEESKRMSVGLERAMTRLGRAMGSSGNMDSTLDTIVDIAMSLVESDAGALDLVTEGGKGLALRASQNLEPHLLSSRLPIDGSLTGMALRTGEPVISEDLGNDARSGDSEGARRANVCSYVAVPLCGPRGCQGVLSLLRSRVKPFSSREVELLQAFAHQAAAAIERGHLTREVNEQATRLNAILEMMQEAVIVADDRGEIEYANRSARALLGREGSDVVGLTIAECMPDGSRGPVQQMWRSILSGREVLLEWEGATDEGRKRYLMLTSSELVPGRRYVLMLHDITREQRLEALRQEFLRNVHHELRTPLSSVLGFTQLILENEDLPEAKVRMGLEAAHRETRRIRSLVDDLQVYALMTLSMVRRPGTRANVVPIVTRAVSEVRQNYPAVQFLDTLPADLPAVACEFSHLLRVVKHLVDNAAKFSRPGGLVEVSGEASMGYVVLHVTDHGIGIEKDRLEEVFDPFHQLDDRFERQYRGIGLGLALVRRVVEGCGGSVTVVSEPGEGSTFMVTLPVAT